MSAPDLEINEELKQSAVQSVRRVMELRMILFKANSPAVDDFNSLSHIVSEGLESLYKLAWADGTEAGAMYALDMLEELVGSEEG